MGVATFNQPYAPQKTSYYADGTPKETADPIAELDKPNPISANTIPELIPKENVIVPPPDEILSSRKYIIDTYHNMTSVNTDRFSTVIDDLKGYAEGTPLKVTYYKQIQAETDTNGITNDVDVRAHQVHQSLLKIHGFEIRLTSSLEYSHETADATNLSGGEALLYPGSNPSKGDRFLMEVDVGKVAEMSITEIPTRLSIKSGTYFKVKFQMVRWMTPELQHALDRCVFNEAYFDKQRYLNEPGALLFHAEFIDMKFMELQSTKMVHYYVNKFLDRQIMFSYMRPDNVYDPYLTDFMLKITDVNEAKQVAAKLYADPPAVEVSIWRALLSETVPLEAVPTSSIINLRSLKSKSVLANSLLNKYYLAWEPGSMSLADFFAGESADASDTDPEDPEPEELTDEQEGLIGDLLLHQNASYRACVLTCVGCTSACCGGDVCTDANNNALASILDGPDEYKELIRMFLQERKLNVTDLRKCISDAYKLSPMEQFYKMPIYIYLARVCVRYIHHVAGIYE